jgi:hypothetical protein
MLAVVAPEQARLTFSPTPMVFERISAPSDRWQPLSSEPPR